MTNAEIDADEAQDDDPLDEAIRQTLLLERIAKDMRAVMHGVTVLAVLAILGLVAGLWAAVSAANDPPATVDCRLVGGEIVCV